MITSTSPISHVTSSAPQPQEKGSCWCLPMTGPSAGTASTRVFASRDSVRCVTIIFGAKIISKLQEAKVLKGEKATLMLYVGCLTLTKAVFSIDFLLVDSIGSTNVKIEEMRRKCDLMGLSNYVKTISTSLTSQSLSNFSNSN